MDRSIVKAGRKNSSMHLYRHALHQAGMGIEEIAADQGISVDQVKKSIAMVEAYKMANTAEILRPFLIDTVLGRKDKVDKALDDALTAKRVGKDGINVPDHERRMKAVEQFRELAKVATPRAPGRGVNVAVHTNQQTAVSTPLPGGGRFEGFEERLRMVRQKVDEHNQLPPPESVAAPLGEDEFDLEEEAPDVGTGDTSG